MRNASPVVLGEIIADKYQIEGVIGEGGMGLVVSAWHLGLRQRVAIKLLLSDGGQIEDAALERFQREARAAARIRSEHVCRVLDVGMLPAGTPYLVLEYLEGCDLADELSRRTRLPADEAIGYVLEACEALAEAHGSGIIHRDLKPANLFLSRRPNGLRCLKLLDFGVSKSVAEASLQQFSLTKTSTIVGSPIYMSPEQLNSAKDVDARTDIWALGALTYELITGQPPFYGETIPQLVSQVLHSDPESFANLGVSDVPSGLEDALRKALSKKRDDRYATVAEFATAIAAFASEQAIVNSKILQIRASSESAREQGREPARDLTPMTVMSREAREGREAPLTPRTAPRPSTAAVTPAAPQTTAVLHEEPRKSWRWAWVALLLVGLAGVAAAMSRRSTSVADESTQPSNATGAVGSARAEPVRTAPPPLPTNDAPTNNAPTEPAPQALPPLVPTAVPTPTATEPAPVTPNGIEAPAERPSSRPRSRPAERPIAPSRDENSIFGGRR